jgi:hypothetical protein
MFFMTHRPARSPASYLAICFLCVTGITMYARYLALEGLYYGVADLIWGLLSDLATCVLIAVLGMVLLACRALWLWRLLLLLWLGYSVANLEMLYAQRRVLALAEVGAGLSWTFLRNSLPYLVFPYFSLLSALLTLLMLRMPVRLDRSSSLALAWPLALIAGLFLTVTHEGDWRRNNVLVVSLVQSWQSQRDRAQEIYGGGAANSPGLEYPDYANTRSLLGSRQDKPNVILLVLEGIPGAYLQRAAQYFARQPQVSMPGLDAIAEQALLVPNFLTHGHQTIRGLYAMLCADYNKLSIDTFKSEEYVVLPDSLRQPCLPSLLRERGYFTSYLQAADLAYMGKDRFMPAAGFEQVVGKEGFSYSYADGSWGPDDKAFLEQATDRIAELRSSESPFFLTLLTVGTHHPFTLPEELSVPRVDRKAAAVRYLDEALAEFWQRLQAQGLLENTLLIITSDETHGIPNMLLSRNWGLFLAVGPGVARQLHSGVHGLVDIPATVLDYVDPKGVVAPPVPGYSALREYPQGRPILFSSLDHFYWLDRQGLIHYCSSPSDCSTWSLADNKLFAADMRKPVAADQLAAFYTELDYLRAASDGRLRHIEKAIVLQQQSWQKSPQKRLSLLEGRYLQLDAGAVVRVSLRLDYRGAETVSVSHQFVNAETKTSLVEEFEIPDLGDGQQLDLQYVLRVPEPVNFAHPSFSVQSARGDGRVSIEWLKVERVSSETESQAPTVTVRKFEKN